MMILKETMLKKLNIFQVKQYLYLNSIFTYIKKFYFNLGGSGQNALRTASVN